MTILLLALIALVLILCALQILVAVRGSARDKGLADVQSQVTAFAARTESQLQSVAGLGERSERALREETARLRDEVAQNLTRVSEGNDRKFAEIRTELDTNLKAMLDSGRKGREEEAATLQRLQDTVSTRLNELSTTQKAQLDSFARQIAALSDGNERRLGEMRSTIEARLRELQAGVDRQLETMRATVDEKLQTTLERRLGESFRLVSERLENVQRGLGEMQALATDVGDLKKVLANVKSRGGWGEVQLEALLDEMLTPDQYEKNARTKKGSNAQVEFAIRLPGPKEDPSAALLLPIDAKFPKESFERLLDAQERADVEGASVAAKELEIAVRNSAREIHDKYLDPPNTTDFALMFVPTEGLYAELLRRPGLAALIQREFRVILTGPMTLAAILNSLQMGFRTMAIQKRSSEVWKLLSAIKTEFGHFGEVLSKVHKKLQEASNTVESAETRTRVIQRRLRDVQELPASEASAMLPGGNTASEPGTEERHVDEEPDA